MNMQMAVLVLLQLILLFVPNKALGQSLCQNECGNVNISYPFGIGKGCYWKRDFEVICNYSSGSPKAFLPGINNLELLEVYSDATIGVNIPEISLKPTTKSNAKGVNLSGSPFIFSTSNRFTAMGCDNKERENGSTVFFGCLAICTCNPIRNSGCCDFLCALSPNISKVFNANISHLHYQIISQNCRSVSVIEEDWIYSKFLASLRAPKNQARYNPAQLDWGEGKGSCFGNLISNSTFCDKDKRYCLMELNKGYICRCSERSQLRDTYCSGTLICTSGHNCSDCPSGYYYSASSSFCYPNLSHGYYDPYYFKKKSPNKYIIIGCSGGLGLAFLLVGIWWLYKFVKRRREIKLKQKFFKRNGGLLLQQELSSNKTSIEKTKLFTSKDLEKATDNYNANRILGQGGQGTVYKGMLTDGRIVAVKKSKLVDESNVEQFINEVVILSQINHRNIVQLLGCCLETQVPLLVYEFIPNGTLYQYIHDQIEEFLVTWEMLLRIAVEVSGALFYLHSAASVPVYHRDIKSANILLDDKYRAKVSDFGTSRSITVDQTHLTTQVKGTFGYVDPEYFRSSQFTEKSDVYSFGVVLVEVLTRQKPIRAINDEEDRSLVGYFLQAMKENRLFEVIDARVLQEAEKEEIITVAMLAKRCLNLNGKKRPTMKEVAFELGGIRASFGASILQQNCEEIDFVGGDIRGQYLETGSSSTGMPSLNSSAFSIDADPLLSNK